MAAAVLPEAVDRHLLLASFAAAAAGVDNSNTCGYTSTVSPAPEADDAALALIQQGNYEAALAVALRAAWAAVGGADPHTFQSTADWFEAAEAEFKQLFTGSSCEPAAVVAAGQQLLLAAVASLYLFTQANLVGPALPLPECPFDWLNDAAVEEWRQEEQQRHSSETGSSSTTSGTFGRDSASPSDRWAASQLCESGEDLVGRIQYPQYLLLARVILLAPLEVQAPPGADAGSPALVLPAAGGAAGSVLQHLPSWWWWAMRGVLLQQRLLSGRSAVLRSLLLGLAARVLAGVAAPVEAALAQLAPAEASLPLPGLEAQLLAAGALLEVALLETAYGHVEAAKLYLQRSSDVLGFHSELTGAMGMRTVHQQDAKAQLLVAVSRQARNPWTAAHAAGTLRDCSEPQGTLEAAFKSQVELPDDLKGFAADSDVLPHPKLVEGAEGGAPPLPSDLHSLEQALLMGWCLHVRKGTAVDGLQPWEMAAYVDAVARQERSQFLLHAAAMLQAARLERQRSRTRDRALLQMEQLADSIGKASDALPPQLRMRYAFGVWFPLQVSLRKELGELLVGLGLVGSALSLFEELELWDNLIVCYQMLDKRVQAEELIRRRLEVTPDEPRLWCALGDLCLEDAHYLQAWERSGHRNARSQRSLARNALRNSNYTKAAGHWELALALNPLHTEGWFSLGYCCIKERDYPRALQAFTRSSQLDPNNGEAWNNLAAIHMHLKHWKQAFNALSEAVKHKRDSWQTWENYAQVAVRVKQWQTSVRALQQVLVLSEGQRLDLIVLAALVGQVEAGRRGEGSCGSGGIEGEGESEDDEQSHPSAASAWGDAAPAAEGAMPAGGAAAEGGSAAGLAELASALGELSTGGGGGGGGGDAGSGAPADAAEAAEALKKAEARAKEVLEQSVGNLMKQVAATVSGGSTFWEVYARYQAAMGYPEAARECLLKRVRALGGSGWQSSQEAFEVYAQASLAMCEAYLQAAEGGGGQRELSSARLHLRGLIKQARERYEEHEAFRQLQQLLQEVEQRQQQHQHKA